METQETRKPSVAFAKTGPKKPQLGEKCHAANLFSIHWASKQARLVAYRPRRTLIYENRLLWEVPIEETKRFYDIFLLTFVGASSWQGWKSVQLDLDMMKARFHKVSTREITRGRSKDPNGSAANFNNFFLIAKRIVLNFPRIVFRVPHDFWSKFRCSGIWRTRWSLHWRSRSWWGGRSWQGGWQGPGRCKGGEDRSNLMIFFTDSWVFSEIRLRQLPWSTYPGIKMY